MSDNNVRQEVIHVNITQIIFWFLIFFICVLGDPDIIDKVIDIMNSIVKLITAYAGTFA